MPTLVVAAWALYTFGVHTFAGQRRVASPLVHDVELPAFSRTTLEVVWHGTTWNLLLAALVIAVHAAHPVPELVALVTLQLAGIAFLFLWLGPRRLGSGFALPQWMLVGPLALASTLLGVPSEITAAVLMLAIAVVHVGWALGMTWPAPSAHAMPAYVIGWPEGARGPGRGPTLAVALVLTSLAVALVLGAPYVRWGVALVFGTRGLVGLIEPRLRPAIVGTPYARLSRFFYSPLCLFIAALAASSVAA